MRYISALLMFAISFPALAQGNDLQNAHALLANPPAKFFTCTVDDDCAVARGICGNEVAINKIHLEEYLKAAVISNSVRECSGRKDLGKPYAVCQSNHCALLREDVVKD